MNSPSQVYGGKSNWGLFLTVPICLVLIAYFLTTGLKSEDRQVAAEALKPAWYIPKTARGDDLANTSMALTTDASIVILSKTVINMRPMTDPELCMSIAIQHPDSSIEHLVAIRTKCLCPIK